MKTLALMITLVLHTTGLWSHAPQSTRDTLTTTGTSIPVHAGQVPLAQGSSIGPLAVQIGQERLHLPTAGAIAVDATTGSVLYAQDPGRQVPLASISKLITVMVILSHHSPSDTVTVPQLPTYDPAAELTGITPGETFKIGDLVQAALIQSGNDAAEAMAIAEAGSNTKFAARMNAKIAEWGITGAHFSSPSGLQDENNYTSAEALAKIAQLALTNPYIRATIAKSETTIRDSAGRSFHLETTNKLLATGKFYGIKTGYTPAAGECFVGLTRIQGREVITVVLGADDRFGVTQTLTNWIQRNWQWL
jgi:D-alanyl-D-alanine carboxypeptidase (penicillin-binding protein 5/6)